MLQLDEGATAEQRSISRLARDPKGAGLLDRRQREELTLPRLADQPRGFVRKASDDPAVERAELRWEAAGISGRGRTTIDHARREAMTQVHTSFALGTAASDQTSRR